MTADEPNELDELGIAPDDAQIDTGIAAMVGEGAVVLVRRALTAAGTPRRGRRGVVDAPEHVLHAAARLEGAREESLDVFLHGAGRQDEALGNALVVQPFCDELEYLVLAGMVMAASQLASGAGRLRWGAVADGCTRRR